MLDANMIIVPYPEAIVELILSSLYPLPLYAYSLEGKARKRQSGKRGPLVSDKNAKIIVRSIIKMYIEKRHIEEYGKLITGSDWEAKGLFNGFWEDLLEAKREMDRDKFEGVLEKYTTVRLYGKKDDARLELPAAFYGQLVNWFLSLQL